jgi:hypothetical protein
MECFYHPGKPAVGICKACEKGLCQDCFSDTGKGGACKGQCEDRVQDIAKLVDFNIKNVQLIKFNIDAIKSKKTYMLSVAALFTLLAIYQLAKGNSIAAIAIMLAVGFGYYGLQLHRNETRIRSIMMNDKE